MSKKKSKPKVEGEYWVIRHPGTGQLTNCKSFEECLTWFEGYNLPYRVVDGKREDLALSIGRMRAHLNNEFFDPLAGMTVPLSPEHLEPSTGKTPVRELTDEGEIYPD